MTAESAVLNTRGVAIAADSAVTIGDRRIYYSGEKICHLSHRHSVGIMTCGNGMFMHIGWELVFIEFGKFLGDRVPDTLEEYVNEFLKFLRDWEYISNMNCEYISDMDTNQANYFQTVIGIFFNRIKENYKLHFSKFIKKENLTKRQKTDSLEKYFRKIRKNLEKEKSVSVYDGDVLVKKYLERITVVFLNVFSDFYINATLKEEAIKLLISFFSKMESPWWNNISSGIIFTGYGERELFPSAIDLDIIGKLGGKLYYTKPNKMDLLHESKSLIGTYAQTEVMQTFIRGIDPYFEKLIFQQLGKISKRLIKIAGKQYKEEIEEQKDDFIDKIKKHGDDNYLLPLKEIITTLPVNNLPEIAEALVALTSLKRHMSTDEETVGGPTDVALITKTDGFVWVKRKVLYGDQAEQR